MCSVLPLKVISKKDNIVVLENKRSAALFNNGDVKIGDYVLVYANIVVRKLGKRQALQIKKLLKE